MKIVNDIKEMISISDECAKKGLSMGLVPTMGYFHDGHLALMREAARHADVVTVSLFVNPSQFGPGEDLDRYPRDLERDAGLAERNGADYLFTPAEEMIYPHGYQTWINVEELSRGLCGGSRPGHFRGVATVVAKLFNIVRPDVAVFGMKDFQQLQVIRRMAADLNMRIRIVGYPVVREDDGLAMSSRNKYLSVDERRKALCLYNALTLVRKLVMEGERSVNRLRAAIEQEIDRYDGIRTDYIFIGIPDTLHAFDHEVEGEFLVALAVYVGKTRLIDNMLITAP